MSEQIYSIVHNNEGIGDIGKCYTAGNITGYVVKNTDQTKMIMKNSNEKIEMSNDPIWNFFYHFLGKTLNANSVQNAFPFHDFTITKSLYDVLDFDYLRMWVSKYNIRSDFVFFILEVICEQFDKYDANAISKCRIPLYFSPSTVNNYSVLKKSYWLKDILASEQNKYIKYLCASNAKNQNIRSIFYNFLQGGYSPTILPIQYINLLNDDKIKSLSPNFKIDFIIPKSSKLDSDDYYFYNGNWLELKYACICNFEDFDLYYSKIVNNMLKMERFCTKEFIGSIMCGFRQHTSRIPKTIKSSLINAIKKIDGGSVPLMKYGLSIAEAIEIGYYLDLKLQFDRITLDRDVVKFLSDLDRAEYCLYLLGEIDSSSPLFDMLSEFANEIISDILSQKYDTPEYDSYVLKAASFMTTLYGLHPKI